MESSSTYVYLLLSRARALTSPSLFSLPVHYYCISLVPSSPRPTNPTPGATHPSQQTYIPRQQERTRVDQSAGGSCLNLVV